MAKDLLRILEDCQGDERLGLVAQKALAFVKGKDFKSWDSPGDGQSSISVARMYSIRMKHKTHRPESFIGLSESMASLASKDVVVHLSVIEVDQGVVSIWTTNTKNIPIGIVVGAFLPPRSILETG